MVFNDGCRVDEDSKERVCGVCRMCEKKGAKLDARTFKSKKMGCARFAFLCARGRLCLALPNFVRHGRTNKISRELKSNSRVR